MRMNIRCLKNRHRGETIWIVGSGASLNFVPRNFFDNGKTVILVNETYRDFGIAKPMHPLAMTYAFAHHRETAQEGIDRGFCMIASEFNRCDINDGLNELVGEYYQYKHPQQPSTLVMDMTPFDLDLDDTLCVGSNTTTSAMDFAGRILGASQIMMCGVDSGSVDGRWNYDGYNGGGNDINTEEQQTPGGTGLPHLRAQVGLIDTMKNRLRVHGVFVGSLNPWIDLGMEGHHHER